jgi:hypothetical protein
MSKVQEFIASGNFVPVAKASGDPLYTATKGDLVLANTSSGTMTVNLPSSPEAGDSVVIVDSNKAWSTNNLTVGRNGSNIDGSAGDYTADGSVNTLELIYSGDATVGWGVRTFGSGAAPAAPAGDYGYAMAGYFGGGVAVSTIQRYDFTSDGNSANVGNLSQSKENGAGCNSSQEGFYMGGLLGSARTSIIEKITFPYDSGATTTGMYLSGNRNGAGGCNSSIHGFTLSGHNGTVYQTTIDRMVFPHDSGNATHVGNINRSRTGMPGANSSSHGYTIGGYFGSWESDIDRIAFPFDSGTATNVGNLARSQYTIDGCNSSNHAFITGGNEEANYFSSCQRLAFPFNSGTMSYIGNLTGNRASVNNFNSTLSGYAFGGYQSGNRVSTIDKFSFPFDSGTATSVGNLTHSGYSSRGVDETDFISMFV